MTKFLAVAAVAALVVSSGALAQSVPMNEKVYAGTNGQTITITIDNGAEGCDANSRIAEGNRRRARWEASRIIREKREQGYTVRVRTLEPVGDGFVVPSVNDGLLIRVGC